MINILDLHRSMSKKKMKRSQSFDRVVELCHKKIVALAENNTSRFFFDVPDYMIGYPLYDLNECIKYVVNALKKNGFIAWYFFPKYIYVSWDLEEIENEKKTTSKRSLDFKEKPSGKLTLDL